MSQFRAPTGVGNMSHTMGIGVSGIGDMEGSMFFNASMAKELFGPCEIKPDKMQIPVTKEMLVTNKE